MQGEASTKNLSKSKASAELLTAMLSAHLLVDALPITVKEVNIVFFHAFKFSRNFNFVRVKFYGLFLQEIVKRRTRRRGNKVASKTFVKIVRQPLALKMSRAEMALLAFREDTRMKMLANNPAQKSSLSIGTKDT